MRTQLTDTEAGNGRYKQTTATFPKTNARKTSFQSAIDTRLSPCFESERLPTCCRATKTIKPSYLKATSFTDESSDSDFGRLGPKQDGSPTLTPNNKPARDEAYSTASSMGGSTTGYDTKIDNFKIVVMGDIFDGIRHRGPQNTRFAASNLLMPPEASDLSLPDF